MPTPKQYWLIRGKPLLYYTVAAFESVDFIDEIVVVVSAGEYPRMFVCSYGLS